MVMFNDVDNQCKDIVKVSLQSDNFYYTFGLSLLINEVNSVLSKSSLCFLVGEPAEDSNEKNIIIRDSMVSIQMNKECRRWRSENNKLNRTTIHIPFGCRQNNLSEIMGKLEKILLIASMDYSSFSSPENHKTIGLKKFMQLSLTECKILLLIGKGHNIGNISRILNRSEKTINTHCRNSIRKLGMLNRVEFYKYASFIAHCGNKDRSTLCL